MEIYKRYVSVRRGECHKRVDSMATGIQEQSSDFIRWKYCLPNSALDKVFVEWRQSTVFQM